FATFAPFTAGFGTLTAFTALVATLTVTTWPAIVSACFFSWRHRSHWCRRQDHRCWLRAREQALDPTEEATCFSLLEWLGCRCSGQWRSRHGRHARLWPGERYGRRLI